MAPNNKMCLICDTQDTRFSYFRFPSNPDLKQAWVQFCVLLGVLRENDNTKYCVICYRHFSQNCLKPVKGRWRLTSNAVPTIYKVRDDSNNSDIDEIPDLYLDERLKELEKFQVDQINREEKTTNKVRSRSRSSVKPVSSHHDYVKEEFINPFEKKCRICLSDEATHDLFTSVIQGEPMDRVYRDLFSVELTQTDGLATSICSPCMQTLDLFYAYKKRVLASEIELQNIKIEEEVEQQQIEEKKTKNRKRMRVQCDQCGYFIFRTKIELHMMTSPRHSLTVMGPKMKQCDECGKLISGSLTAHQTIHHKDVMSYICEHCGEGFRWRRLLVAHLSVHTNIKPFKCKDCGNGYDRYNSLWRHRQKVHFGRKFSNNIDITPCPYCGRLYMRKSSLNEHIATKHRYKCWCGAKFKDEVSKTKHSNKMHPKNKFICNTCNEKLPNRRDLFEHKKTHQSDPVSDKCSERRHLNTHQSDHSEEECSLSEFIVLNSDE